MAWRIDREVVEIFRKTLWKDARDTRVSSSDSNGEIFIKACTSPEDASFEFDLIKNLHFNNSSLCPEPFELFGDRFSMRRIEGIRLYDLVRILWSIELERRDGKAAAAREIVFRRQRSRLELVQRFLLNYADKVDATAYPLGEKIERLFYLFSRIFGIGPEYERCNSEIKKLENYWVSSCSQVMFRDATIKNMMVELPDIGVTSRRDDISRRAYIENLLCMDRNIWEYIPLWEIDFTSCVNLTAIEDDVVSLNFFELSEGTCDLSAESLNLVQDIFPPDDYRAACALFVRYLRFGGRKLAYRIINSQGAAIRFRFDDPLFYFESIERKCRDLSVEFVEDFPNIFSFCKKVWLISKSPSPSDVSMMRVDHFRKIFEAAKYWQESPAES